MTQTLTLPIPDRLYHQLLTTAQATQQSLDAILLRVLEVGSPPQVTDAPTAIQAELMALNELSNEALWQQVYPPHLTPTVPPLSPDLSHEEQLQAQAEIDRAVLRRAHAAAILRWRGCIVPLP